MPQFLLDMVHHNPGEAPFATRFLDPAVLAGMGWNGQVFKHINCVATYAALGDFFPAGSPDRAWLDAFTAGIQREIRAAKAQGLQVFYHIDLFVLPKRLVERFRDRLVDARGRISIDQDFTLEVHRALFAELTQRFPEVDGYIIRHGETYLHDTPYHQGNGPVPFYGPAVEPDKELPRFERMLRFLREEVCERQGRWLIFRTWDTRPDRFHADPGYFSAIVSRVPTHPKLVLSIKHTRLDFFRAVEPNACLGLGPHPQIVEVQCQREYEGKGAYPDYIARGVIHGFAENATRTGLADWSRQPWYRGVYTWTRGGGWYGPYIAHELWCDLNAHVVTGFAAGRGSEAELFAGFARDRLGLDDADQQRFRELCLLSADAVLKGRYCAADDALHKGLDVPVNLWMRDDRLGGTERLAPILARLREHGAVDDALAEKAEAVALWERIVALANQIRCRDEATTRFLRLSCRYGLLLFRIVRHGWECAVLAGGHGDRARAAAAVAAYRAAWDEYRALGREPGCPSLYHGYYFAMPGQPPAPGLDDLVAGVAAEYGVG